MFSIALPTPLPPALLPPPPVARPFLPLSKSRPMNSNFNGMTELTEIMASILCSAYGTDGGLNAKHAGGISFRKESIAGNDDMFQWLAMMIARRGPWHVV